MFQQLTRSRFHAAQLHRGHVRAHVLELWGCATIYKRCLALPSNTQTLWLILDNCQLATQPRLLTEQSPRLLPSESPTSSNEPSAKPRETSQRSNKHSATTSEDTKHHCAEAASSRVVIIRSRARITSPS
jgi:hypothetical protein